MSIDFTQKFNVGLTLKTSVARAKKFFAEYARYIGEVYFSLPLGDKYHTRQTIRNRLTKPRDVKKFWQLIDIVRANGIRLEMVLNTYGLTDADIEATGAELARRGVDIQSVCFMDEYYDAVTRVFPGKTYICSYNNVFHSTKEMERIQNRYDYYVLGGALIRDNAAFRYVNEVKNAKVILLLNNGCSFNCPGYCNAEHCKPVFLRNKKKHSLNYLYALQSVLPPELHDGTIDVSAVDAFKISNRSSSLKYAARCIDSYMTNSTKKYLRRGFISYSLWARMGPFWSRFIRINRKKMLAYKAEIIGHDLELK